LGEYKEYFDIVFSSPPYFNVERYSYDDTQSWVRYKTIDDWNKNFLHKTIANVWPTIKKGGYLAVNIADVYAASKGDGKGQQEITNPMNDFISTLEGAEYQGCLGMEMAKRPGSAGAGMIIEGDEERYSEEELKKNEEAKDKTFCEPVWVWRKM
jgi:DNA modification methylase